MAAHEPHLISGSRHDANVDAAVVVSVDYHDLVVGLALDLLQDDVGELLQRDTVFRLDHS
jgi:hypothetical protein